MVDQAYTDNVVQENELWKRSGNKQGPWALAHC